jgi:taurine dioxygenase
MIAGRFVQAWPLRRTAAKGGCMAIDIRPLSPVLGAEVLGIDLSGRLDDTTAKDIKDAWLKYHVLVFRGQAIEADDQRRFVGYFGELQPPRSRAGQRLNPDVMYVANVVIDGERGDLPDGEMQFHADQCYYECPTKGAVLYALEIPSTGGNTLFASTHRAYEALPHDLKLRIEGLEALFTYDAYGNPYKRAEINVEQSPHFVHPIVIVHPETARPALFVNRLMTASINGLAREESEALLEQLFQHVERPEITYEHVWRPGDVLIWDNLATVHARTDFDPAERRALRRMAIRGVRPRGLATHAATVPLAS